MRKYIYSDFIPESVKFFTAGKRYEIIERFSDHNLGQNYQVRVKDDDGVIRGPLNVGKPCDYLLDKNFEEHSWKVEAIKDE